MKRIFILITLLAILCGSASAAGPVSSYADVQDMLLAAAYKVPPFDAVLTGTIYAMVPSYSSPDIYYLFVMVDPDDVSFWSTEDDNFFVALINTKGDPLPYELGESITVEGQIVSTYSSPVCPYLYPKNITVNP